MATNKMTTELIEDIFNCGKNIYIDKNIKKEAIVRNLMEKYPDQAAKASLEYYVDLYPTLMKGNMASWNYNQDLLYYFASKFAEESNLPQSKAAFVLIYQFAKSKSLDRLVSKLQNLSKGTSMESGLVDEEQEKRVFLYNQKVGNSVLKDGFTVKKNAIEIVFKHLGINLNKGEKHPIKVSMLGEVFDADLYNLGHGGIHESKTDIQIRYSPSKKICIELRRVFKHSFDRNCEGTEESFNIYLIENGMLEFEPIPFSKKYILSEGVWPTLLYMAEEKHNKALVALACLFDFGGEATCKQLSEKYGEEPGFYNRSCVSFAEYIAKSMKISLDNDFDKYWKILFTGRPANNEEPGVFVWKIRDELASALKSFKIERYLPVRDNNHMDRTILPLSDVSKLIDEVADQKAFIAPDGMIENILLSLKTKPFVIFAGVSGTGKSRIVRLLSEAVGGKYVLIPVHPDWSDSTDLLGHVNLDGEFVPGILTETLEEASRPENAKTPYFICLDEMNLARVEYYFSDFLSIIETRRSEDGKIVTDRIFKESAFGTGEKAKAAKSLYGDLIIPENVYIIGTVNMDETTYPFSKKVLDRANTIEFTVGKLSFGIDDIEGPLNEVKPIELDNSVLKSSCLDFRQCCKEYHDEMLQMVNTLQDINVALEPINAQIAYRVRNEIAFYLYYALSEGMLSYEEAMDNAIMQKILPRVQGNSNRLKKVLLDIINAIGLKNTTSFKIESFETELDKYVKSKGDAPFDYCRTVRKIDYMVKGLSDGYTSYWI